MPRPGGGSLGHSKHHQAFGKARHGYDLIVTAQALNQKDVELARIHAAQQEEMYDSVHEAFEAARRQFKRQRQRRSH